jgi:hypothetical protein
MMQRSDDTSDRNKGWSSWRRKRCPNCNTQLRTTSRWFGFVRDNPRRCHQCGVKLLYDTAGGVYIHPESRNDA